MYSIYTYNRYKEVCKVSTLRAGIKRFESIVSILIAGIKKFCIVSTLIAGIKRFVCLYPHFIAGIKRFV